MSRTDPTTFGRPVRRLAAMLGLLALSLLVLSLTACGGDDTGAASPASASKGLPAVTGGYGEKPTLSVPEADPDAQLRSAVLSEGDGPEVASGDLLVVFRTSPPS